MNNIPFKKACIDKKFMAMAIFIPQALINPLTAVGLYISVIYSYLFLGCYVGNFAKNEVKNILLSTVLPLQYVVL